MKEAIRHQQTNGVCQKTKKQKQQTLWCPIFFCFGVPFSFVFGLEKGERFKMKQTSLFLLFVVFVVCCSASCCSKHYSNCSSCYANQEGCGNCRWCGSECHDYGSLYCLGSSLTFFFVFVFSFTLRE